MHASLVCFICTVNGHHKKKRKKKPWKTGASSGHITNLKESILDFWYLCQEGIKKKLETSKLNQTHFSSALNVFNLAPDPHQGMEKKLPHKAQTIEMLIGS